MNEAAVQLVRFVLPIMYAWFVIGFFITVLYHLSLFFVWGEFHNPDELLLDLAFTAVRVPLYFFAWPVVLFFDRGALHSIRLFWEWLEPKNREQEGELKQILDQRRLYQETRRKYEQDVARRVRRRRELLSGEEKRRRTRQIRSDEPVLAQVWLTIGLGTDSSGARQLVFLFPEAVLSEEVKEAAGDEVRIRREWRCVRCREELVPVRIELPEPFFLEVIDEGKVLISGWAFEGVFRERFPDCPKCGAVQPVIEQPVTILGRADEVVTAVKQGAGFAPEEPEPVLSRIMYIRAGGVVRVLVGLLGLIAVLLMVGVCIWAVVFFIFYFQNLGG
ncbi:MAG: hypothetical protein ABIK48_05350 [candidate division WOR-3 bacterium]